MLGQKLIHLQLSRLKGCDVRLRPPLGRVVGCALFEHSLNLENLFDLTSCERGDDVATARSQDHPSLYLEATQRLPQGQWADSQGRSQLLLFERRAVLQFTSKNGFSHIPISHVRKALGTREDTTAL